MKLPRTNSGVWIAIGAMAASLSLPINSRAQDRGVGPVKNPLTQIDGSQTVRRIEEKSLGDPKAEKAYEKFHGEKNLDKKTKLGQEFINRYPSSYHADAVYEELAQTYYAKHDLANFYKCADEGMARFPDDPTLLAVTGATMARAYNREDPDAEKKLEKAESYVKQAIELMKDPKIPANTSDEQFAVYKKQVLTTAHSGLGLIYFRRAQFEDSLKEIQEAMQGAATPDATDLLVLGADFQNLNRFKEAADAFNRCAQIEGPLQAGCKDYADRSAKQGAPPR
ncbi:MAG TPA: tetratricopeptide repeat protein [Candidatus Polarisedimenticolia bacterium]|nr:tetratricopeptide repeat protein [Candidatus Polarisedimenticolia bacterium]